MSIHANVCELQQSLYLKNKQEFQKKFQEHVRDFICVEGKYNLLAILHRNNMK